ncbi:MAG: chromosome segregation protein SMC [Acidobacteria bacterium]|nr:MAG: chromosome segregation protein SMC [Acidobacteriota bacterium]
MLRLDQLEITGFKSFADKTSVRFEEGISGIVGPNGCGKSNLADAIAWVLGSGTALSLRGEKMDDVIFSGTRKRRPSGVVEATLTFSRTDSEPIVLKETEFSGEVLEISRKLYRSGESVYSVNQRRCRLKDIHSVLEEAGLGFASYALIAQGKIGWFLRAKPVERRAVIEEAARITGYKSRRRSAELKLELAQQNLLRVNDIVGEIERRLRSLKRQAATARRYQKVKEEFRQVQRQKFVIEAHQLKVRLEVLERELEQLKTSEVDVGKELAQGEKVHHQTLEQRDQLEAELAQLRQSLSETRLEVDRTENSIRYHREQIEASRKTLDMNAAEQQAIAQSLEQVGEELMRFQSEYSDLEKEEKQIEAAIQEQTERVARHENEVGKAESRAAELQTGLLQLSAETASLNNLKGQLEQRLKAAHANRERLERERARHSLKLEESSTCLAETQVNLEKKRSEATLLSQQLDDQRSSKTELESQLEEIREEATETQRQLIAQEERLHSLQELQLSHAQYSEGVQKILQHLNSTDRIKTNGTLADFIETKPEYERLVEEFLDEELEYILVDSLEEAVLGVSELRTLKSGRCTFLTLSSSNGFQKSTGHPPVVGSVSKNGVHGTLADLLQMKPEIKNAFTRTLPQRAEAIVVSDLESAFQLAPHYPERTFVTLAGESLTPRGLLSASTAQAKKLGLLSLKRQKRELEERILTVQAKLSALREQEGKKQVQLQAALENFTNREESLRQLEKEMIGLTHQEEQWEGEKQLQIDALKVLKDELTQLHLEQEKQAGKVQEVEQQFIEKQASQAEDEKMLSQIQESLQQLRVEFGRIREQLHSVSSNGKVLDERRLALGRTVERIQEQRKGLEARKEATQATRTQTEERSEKMTANLETLATDISSHQETVEQLTASLDEREKEYSRWKENYSKSEKQLVDLRERKEELQEERAQVDVDLARVETQLQNINQQCMERLQISLDEAAVGIDPDEVPAEVVQQYNDLKQRLDNFGPINMAALQEYQEIEERHNFLESQRQDIEGSIADTTRAIREINRRSSEKFRDAFEAINRHFNEIFQKLFGGGECGMRLLDEEDLLESGVDIYAQPPGKKLQNVRLLSGGEEALTVFALLMGIFTYRPSRFCVLDEVDAPLDDANVTRFTNLIQEMSEQTQFIVITHNKHTMQTANTLYGITMEEAGVSQVVSVKFPGQENGDSERKP